MKWLNRYMPDYLRFAIPAWICLFGEVIVDLSLPTLMATIVNVGIGNRDTDFIMRYGGIMLAIALMGAALGQTRNWLSSHASQNLGTGLRADLFRKTQGMSIAALRKMGASSLITRLTNDVMQVQNMSLMLTRIFIRAPLLLIGGIIMAFSLNREMASILIFILPVIGVLIYIRMKRGFPLFKKVQAAIDKVNEVLREYLAGVRVVKVFNRSDYEQDRFDQANRNLTDQGIRAARAMASIQPLIFIVMNGSIVILLWIGGVRVDQGRAQVGDIMAFVNYFIQILFAMNVLSRIFTMGVRAKTSLDRISQVFAIDDELADSTVVSSPPDAGRIEMRDVTYTYPGQKSPVLSDLSFVIKPGQTAAIIGSTGAGKSTLINLLPRFDDVQQGQILVDGVDIREMKKEDLRQKIAMVPQKSTLFTGTLLENLLWGNQNAAMEDVEEAITIAQAKEFIDKMPKGLDSRIGQGGVNLSGGQKQRVCIARALLKNSPVLIMDDSTSAVDLATEHKLRTLLKKKCRDKTVIIIAQRIHSVMQADTILVMDNGRLIDQGRHKDLLRRSPIYRDIYRSQIGLDQTGEEVI